MSNRSRTDEGRKLLGVAASQGIARGKAVVYARPDLDFQPRTVDHPRHEVQRLEAAVAEAIEELATLKLRVLEELGEESAHIFRSQQTVLEDESIIEEMKEVIAAEKCLAETAVQTVFSVYLAMFEELDENDYNRERMADLDDVQKRVLRNLLGVEDVSLAHLDEESIVVASELYPSDTAMMDRRHVRGVITELGGITSHAAILAGNLGIPAAVAVAEAVTHIAVGDDLYLDVSDPEIATTYVNPDGATRKGLDQRREAFEARRRRLAESRHLAPETRDGHRVDLSANVGSIDEIELAHHEGARSIGLLRSEFLFIGEKRIPDEEKQYRAYRAAVEAFPEGFVVLRTLDIGADKPVESISVPEEQNPFLGYRGIRISLDRADLFRIQLRAALRASAHGNLKVMFPMVSGPNEMQRILAVLAEVRRELDREGAAYDEAMEIGVMIEVPSAVLMAEELAGLVDFFSIGTNDLTQYLLAADRMNSHIREFYQPYHPAVFRAIRQVVAAAHDRGKWVGVCGELGGMPLAIPVLVGLGVDELSMSSRSLPEALHVLRQVSRSESRALAGAVLGCSDETEIRALLRGPDTIKE
jgi:phosphoenolpyruvate-protein phosphotransferase (PTS system enzyme I)